MSRISCTLKHLRDRGISETIIQRVERLNPDPEPGRRIRGYHLTHFERDEMWVAGYFPRAQVIGELGREAFDRIPRSEWRRCGRRVYVSHLSIKQALL